MVSHCVRLGAQGLSVLFCFKTIGLRCIAHVADLDADIVLLTLVGCLIVLALLADGALGANVGRAQGLWIVY